MNIYLKEILQKKKISIKKMANDLNIPYQTLSNYCRNVREPDLFTLKIISEYLHVTLDELILGIQPNRMDDADYIEMITILSKYAKSNR
jgi:transcriptional regulator with XRE-family HTH domain